MYNLFTLPINNQILEETRAGSTVYNMDCWISTLQATGSLSAEFADALRNVLLGGILPIYYIDILSIIDKTSVFGIRTFSSMNEFKKTLQEHLPNNQLAFAFHRVHVFIVAKVNDVLHTFDPQYKKDVYSTFDNYEMAFGHVINEIGCMYYKPLTPDDLSASWNGFKHNILVNFNGTQNYEMAIFRLPSGFCLNPYVPFIWIPWAVGIINATTFKLITYSIQNAPMNVIQQMFIDILINYATNAGMYVDMMGYDPVIDLPVIESALSSEYQCIILFDCIVYKCISGGYDKVGIEFIKNYATVKEVLEDVPDDKKYILCVKSL